MTMPDTRISRGRFELIPNRLVLNNPVMAASGTFGYGTEFAARNDLSSFGAVVCKGITLHPRRGTKPPRITETPAGALNAIGLANIGVAALIREKCPQWERLPVPFLVNINGETVEEFRDLAARLEGVPGVSAIEVNVSCPNVARGGMLFGRDPTAAAFVTTAVRGVTTLPILVKLTPNTDQLVEVARAVEDAGAEALTVANTYIAMAVDARHGRPVLSNVTGGLSGPAIKPLTLRLVRDAAEVVKIPIVGCGGIITGEDVVEYMSVGASAVQVGTATLANPYAVPRIAREFSMWMANHGCTSPTDIRVRFHDEAGV